MQVLLSFPLTRRSLHLMQSMWSSSRPNVHGYACAGWLSSFTARATLSLSTALLGTRRMTRAILELKKSWRKTPASMTLLANDTRNRREIMQHPDVAKSDAMLGA